MASRNPKAEPAAREKGPAIAMKAVESEAVGSVGYDPGRKVLAVYFNNGSTYHYAGVPSDLVDRLLDAKSKGAFVQKHVKGQFPAERK
jgi:hypothetical protein